MVELTLVDAAGKPLYPNAKFDRVPVAGEAIWVGKHRFTVASVEFAAQAPPVWEAYVVLVPADTPR